MTIYSQHANRGRTQILATYAGDSGVTSSTVTSLDDPELAAPIIDALNRISACATLPVSIYDTRNGAHGYYPADHLAALVDHDRREDLLTGTHSLWYEYAKVVLHRALTDLDSALANVPQPVRTAIEAELDVEVRDLRAGLQMFNSGTWPNDAEPERFWDFAQPFVTFDGGMGELSSDVRDDFDKTEEDFTAEELSQVIIDLRILYAVASAPSNGNLTLEEINLSIFNEPGYDLYYLNIDAPLPGDPHRTTWEIHIGQWDKDLDEPENEGGTATGESVLSCALPSRPTVTDLANLLNDSSARPDRMAAWAKTSPGQPLTGTPFTVTKRYGD